MITEPKKRDVALVVDDSPETLRLLTDALDGAGMTVMVALDGASRDADRRPDHARHHPARRRDARHGRLRDLPAAEARRGPRPMCPIIFMTGLAETEHIVRGLEAGGVDYVTKPIVIEEMLARIRVHLANARLTQSARAALDVSGRYPARGQRPGQDHVGDAAGAEAAVGYARRRTATTISCCRSRCRNGWIRPRRARPDRRPQRMAAFPSNEQLRLQYMGKLGPNEFLLRLAKDSGADTPAEFSSELGLTTREGEVLSWLSKGKTNRDIAQILGLSPRTVDKHLEQIYAKLGVENRTAAAAIATNAARKNT